ncbi:hypothetical protein KQI30_16370 [Clostridium bornimense]|uniref:hypothetical protein n=1 Tax=Clostridium bornimense TaxID=1216932 RepID=UPI001C0FF93B|nr:hypothetical protein [Clostridium bornimense]MBU5317825.1 hypothetical protein [Clostridium bornimense]
MWDLKYDLKNLIHYKSGYEYISSFKIYIPITEVGLNILIRKEQQIPFFHEIILKLVNNGICRVNQISDISGVDLDILNDVIGDMSVNDLIYVKSNSLMLTTKGRRTLETLKNITIEKDNINNIYIDCITGNIYDELDVVKNPPKFSAWLEKCVDIDERFISKKFNDINSIFLERQKEYSQGIFDINSNKEIYQILDKEYENTFYLEKKINFFKNDLDGSNLLEFENHRDEEYRKELMKQINSRFGAKQFLIDKKKLKENIKIDFNINNEMYTNLKDLVNFLVKSERNNQDKLNELYFKNRYMIADEIRWVLLNLKNIKPAKIIIKSSNLHKYLNDNIIAFLKIFSSKAYVEIIADKNEKNIENLRNKLTIIGKNKNKINWIYKDNINEDNILLYPYALIKSYSVAISYNNDDYIIKEISEIYFDESNIKENNL